MLLFAVCNFNRNLPLLFAQLDYQTQIQPIFNDNCTSCHGSNGGAIYDHTTP